ncbi:MAG TPA: hypothetical protein DCL54_07635 [Alphaproteobacteria bacterium]|nr:hypothetical protein [Alphaproteobacteria bacterium]HAJ46434.1 hypothetical protein [Alphaproteobacteria bacterium]
MSAPRGPSIIFEFVYLGAYVKAVAVDEATGLEVAVTGPANTPKQYLETLALAKLRRALEKRDDTSG